MPHDWQHRRAPVVHLRRSKRVGRRLAKAYRDSDAHSCWEDWIGSPTVSWQAHDPSCVPPSDGSPFPHRMRPQGGDHPHVALDGGGPSGGHAWPGTSRRREPTPPWPRPNEPPTRVGVRDGSPRLHRIGVPEVHPAGSLSSERARAPDRRARGPPGLPPIRGETARRLLRNSSGPLAAPSGGLRRAFAERSNGAYNPSDAAISPLSVLGWMGRQGCCRAAWGRFPSLRFHR